MEIRVASPDDLDRLTETLAEAFAADPLWSWALEGLLDELVGIAARVWAWRCWPRISS